MGRRTFIKVAARTVELPWSGASGRRVDIRRNGAVVATKANDGLHTDTPGGAGTFRYQVAETGGGRLSNEVTVTL